MSKPIVNPSLREALRASYDGESERYGLEGHAPKIFMRRWTAVGTGIDSSYHVHVVEREPLGLLAKIGIVKPTIEATVTELFPPFESHGADCLTYTMTLTGDRVTALNVQAWHANCYEGEDLSHAAWVQSTPEMDQSDTTGRITQILQNVA